MIPPEISALLEVLEDTIHPGRGELRVVLTSIPAVRPLHPESCIFVNIFIVLAHGLQRFLLFDVTVSSCGLDHGWSQV